jgi:hypothetical protein
MRERAYKTIYMCNVVSNILRREEGGGRKEEGGGRSSERKRKRGAKR